VLQSVLHLSALDKQVTQEDLEIVYPKLQDTGYAAGIQVS